MASGLPEVPLIPQTPRRVFLCPTIQNLKMALVKPTIAAASQTVSLSPMDQSMLRVYVMQVLCFPLSSLSVVEHKKIYAALRLGLARTLSEIPIIGGFVVPEDGGRGRVRLDIADGYGGQLVYQDFTGDSSGLGYSYAELQEAKFPPSTLDSHKLAPVSKFPDSSQPAPVMASQANFFNGGLMLTICFHHSALDASSFATILKRWATNTRADAEISISKDFLASSTDRTPMMQGRSGATIADFPEYKVLNDKSIEQLLWSPSSLLIKEYCILYFSKSRLAELKVFSSPASDSGEWISSNDALCAFLWHHISLARGIGVQKSEELGAPKPLDLAMAVDGRQRLSPPAPIGYIGNAIWFCQTTLSQNLVTSPNLPQIAKAIRAAIIKLDSAYMKGVINAISLLPTVAGLTFTCYDHPGRTIFISSWADTGLYDLDWELIGRAEAVRFPRFPIGGGVGTCVISPRLSDKGLEVLLGLEVETMQRLKASEDFKKFAKWRCA